jgi:hypothetical protein
MTSSDDAPTSGPKKRFIGKARAEALRKKLAENQSGPNIEDGVISTISMNKLVARLILGIQPRGGRIVNQIPAEVLEDVALNEAIKIVNPSI